MIFMRSLAFIAGWLLVLVAGGYAQTTRPASEPACLKIRVATYNIESGRKAQLVLENIRAANPDVVLLQEAHENNVRAFADALGMSRQFGPYSPKTTTGIGILAVGNLKPVKLFSMPKERNFALAATLETAGQKILLVAAHFKSLPRPLVSGLFKTMGPHQEQAKQIVDLVKKQNLPAVVGGDFNTLAFTPGYRILSTALKDSGAATGTSSQPSIIVNGTGYRIDHILVRGPWKIRASQVSPKPGSDHRLLWADLELPPLKETRP